MWLCTDAYGPSCKARSLAFHFAAEQERGGGKQSDAVEKDDGERHPYGGKVAGCSGTHGVRRMGKGKEVTDGFKGAADQVDGDPYSAHPGGNVDQDGGDAADLPAAENGAEQYAKGDIQQRGEGEKLPRR